MQRSTRWTWARNCCHLLWLKAHLKWTQCKIVLWSDKLNLKFILEKLDAASSGLKMRGAIWVLSALQKPASLIVWRCIGACGTASLHIWKGIINFKEGLAYFSETILYLLQQNCCVIEESRSSLLILTEI